MLISSTEIVFADDLNAYREFTLDIPNDILMNSARKYQQELDKWGRANQVAFDPKKESTHCVSHVAPKGEDFKILGVRFDCRLTMANAVDELVNETQAHFNNHALTQVTSIPINMNWYQS